MTLRNLITSIKVVKNFPNLTWLPNFLQHWYCNHIILQKYLKSHNILSRQIWALIFFLFISASFFRQIVWEIEIIWDQYFFPLYISFKIEVQNVLQSDFSYSCSTLNPAAQTRIIWYEYSVYPFSLFL